jgi:cellulose synthase/poly-beta-1,6-N-acetylglucosamine synthase-like glycosyltransferase
LIVLKVFVFACLFYLLFPLISALLATLIHKFRYNKGITSHKAIHFACVITAYKDLEIAWPLVRALLNQEYPHFTIYLVGDACEGQPIEVEAENLIVLLPSIALNSKVASLHHALTQVDEKATHIVVFDPDNLVPYHFLSHLAGRHAQGFDVVQGKRIAKNIDSTYAALDALGEYYYDYSVRAVPFYLGSSSTIAGSGMSIERSLYEESLIKEMNELSKMGVVVSEDKSLQLQMVRKGKRIAYAASAIIFDEKITRSEQIGKQRGRWLNSYFRHSKESLNAFLQGVLTMDWNLTFFAVVVLMPPMIILVALSTLLFLVTLFLSPQYSILIMGALFLFVLGFLLILIINRAPAPVINAIPKIPLFVLGQLSGFMNIRRANRDFMATDHSRKMEIEEVWEKRKQEFID